jgi:hypothetical protein
LPPALAAALRARVGDDLAGTAALRTRLLHLKKPAVRDDLAEPIASRAFLRPAPARSGAVTRVTGVELFEFEFLFGSFCGPSSVICRS